ncbi:multifunctional acyl-CoA thioesterase I/protease I/lysophospholipase L1 [Psychromonas sp. psych-6C06]|uniref:multifunctional acyl-CoA thioesterase I/protease I/lysophospholipase L1 n=1 Tax=Psychromonas sp. psych-6C06 TaxID=2058089 RepID=UPI000C34DFA7|nr:multifunctional acyl-CoA thioesterase I/protease I/lysophospholipase L1 [Psychromonas sp. psych-6C06]PKF61632.1 multifunctional acyl-CoA thioesterase I/protease I/lysophospholipase L1 [Psychromonas sp. psych-6C06]
MIKLTFLVVSTLCSLMFSLMVYSNTLLIVGDSLSAGYQMRSEQSWPALLPEELQKQGKKVTVINASISGDTTGNGVARLPALLNKHQPDYVLIELGANDGLRGFSPNIVNKNLTKMINNIKKNDARPLLMQIHVPTNYGKRYSQAFAGIYPTLSEQHKVPLLPFFLEHVITKPEWMMKDGLHPKAEAQPWIAQFMAQALSTEIN